MDDNFYNTFGGAFWLSVATITCGGLSVMINFCFKSKCSEMRLCSKEGLIFIKRDVDAENQEMKMELESTPRNGGSLV